MIRVWSVALFLILNANPLQADQNQVPNGLTEEDQELPVNAPRLSEDEQKDVNDRLREFYRKDLKPEQMPAQMFQKVKKYNIKEKRFLEATDKIPNQRLKLSDQLRERMSEREKESPFLDQAQAKASDEYFAHYCDTYLHEKFPKLLCKEDVKWEAPTGEAEKVKRAYSERNDEVADLLVGWVPRGETIIRDLNSLPTSGETKIPVWSDDYWAIKYGVTSHRYEWEESDQQNWSWKDAVSAYSQPGVASQGGFRRMEWAGLLSSLRTGRRISPVIEFWSPAEKYDLTVGDTSFSLTNQQKREGEGYWDTYNKVESWMGICHGWAPASMMVPPAAKEVTFRGPKNVNVTWYPHDVAAITSLAWAKGQTPTNFVGGRCNAKDTRTFPNGRLRQQECFDNAPNTFLLALGNLIGKHKKSFVMDKTFDYEVWNQPVHSYTIQYFKVDEPNKRSYRFNRALLVDYQDDYRGSKLDRFSNQPVKSHNTRGKRKERGIGYDDRSVDSIIGFIVTVVYVSESYPSHSSKPTPPVFLRATYTGDLELEKRGNKYIAVGGEWHSNAHPDFLWVPEGREDEGSAYGHVARTNLDRRGDADLVTISKDRAPSRLTTREAALGGRQGYPLCQVVKQLVNASKDGRKVHPVNPDYHCYDSE